MDRTLDCGSSGWWFDPTRGRKGIAIKYMAREFDDYFFGAEPQEGVDYICIDITQEQLYRLLNPPPLTSAVAANLPPETEKGAGELAYLMHVSSVLDETQRKTFEDAFEKKQGIRLGLTEN